MLRLLIGTGLLLMAVGFGAAGWQYWQGTQQKDGSVSARETGIRVLPETWLISPTGEVIPRGEIRAFLVQDRFVPERSVIVTRSARLDALLAEGEKLPDAPYLEVLADIRAPRLALALCPVLTERIAQSCAVNAARVVEGSVDPVSGTAEFQIELVYRLKSDSAELPDLADRVLGQEDLILDLSTVNTASPEAALAVAVEAATAACASSGSMQNCRITGLVLDWGPGREPFAQARIAWLAPLPKGMIAAPPLTSPSGG